MSLYPEFRSVTDVLLYEIKLLLGSLVVSSGVSLFETTFDNDDLSDGYLTINHKLNSLKIFNINIISPENMSNNLDFEIIDANNVKVYIGGPIDGTYSLYLLYK